jgi:acetate kinase
MNVLVFNCGSSSLKYKVIEMPGARQCAGGEAQRVGPPTAEPARILHRVDGTETVHVVEMRDHASAFDEVMKLLCADPRLVPDVVGHRMVHGGTLFRNPILVDESVMQGLLQTQSLAPLHNPPAIRLIEACRNRYPELPQVVVFDTAYHGTIPDYAATYALPRPITEQSGIRKYGFHGTSHQFVVNEAAAMLGIPVERFCGVSCHLGSGGASLCAVINGKSVDNTMGYSPLQGLMMSTRCGDLDPAVTLRLLALSDGNTTSVENLLNKKSGVLGMSGLSADIRDVFSGLARGDSASPRLNKTAQVYLWRLRKYLGSYLTVVQNPDAVIFTDTIGETVPEVRWAVCAGMEAFGLKMDPEKNESVSSYPCDIAADDSPVRILVILTNEELAIARQSYLTLESASSAATKGERS